MAQPSTSSRYDKGERRREALLRSAIEIVAEEGIRGVTHRAVTERAGAPFTSVAYFFGSIEELGIEAVRLAAQELTTKLEALAEHLAASKASPAEIGDLFAQVLVAFPRTLELARYEVLLYAARSPEQADAVGSVVQTIEHVAEVALRAAGAPRPAEAARGFAALAEGFTLHHLVAPRPDDVEVAAAAYRAHFIAAVMDGQELTRWHRRLDQSPG